MKKLLLGFLAVIMLWGVNVNADESTIDIEVRGKNLSEIVAIVSDINVKENVNGVTYEITNEKAVLSISLVDSSRYDETMNDVFAIDGVEPLDEANNQEVANEPTTETAPKCETISEKDIQSIVTANYILYATLVILLILIVVILVLLFKNKDTKKKK